MHDWPSYMMCMFLCADEVKVGVTCCSDCSLKTLLCSCRLQPHLEIQPTKSRFASSVSILDLDPKPYESIPHQHKLDTKIVNYYLMSKHATQELPPSSLYTERQDCTLLFHPVWTSLPSRPCCFTRKRAQGKNWSWNAPSMCSIRSLATPNPPPKKKTVKKKKKKLRCVPCFCNVGSDWTLQGMKRTERKGMLGGHVTHKSILVPKVAFFTCFCSVWSDGVCVWRLKW